MIYFLLPSAHPLLFKDIKVDVRDIEPPLAVSHSLSNYMNEIKEKIASREKEWDMYKKYTNPYEYIHSIVPHKKKAVSKYKPISRSYFKMIEIITEFQIIPAHHLQNVTGQSDSENRTTYCAHPISAEPNGRSTNTQCASGGTQGHKSSGLRPNTQCGAYGTDSGLPFEFSGATHKAMASPVSPRVSALMAPTPDCLLHAQAIGVADENIMQPAMMRLADNANITNSNYRLLQPKSLSNTPLNTTINSPQFVSKSSDVRRLWEPITTQKLAINPFENNWKSVPSHPLNLYTTIRTTPTTPTTPINRSIDSIEFGGSLLKHSASEGPNFYSEWRRAESPPFSFPVEPARTRPIRTFHLAEGPGGFIEAVCNRRNNLEDQYYGMTILIDEYDDNVPAWNKTSHFLAQHPNVHIETGADGTGNILHIDNFDYCVAKYGGTMDLVTADGGFDFSKDFNKQEVSITNLLWGQVCYALALQRQGGNFVLKIFDCFYEHTIDILYILSAFYSEVIVSKLQTSRVGNSEKYVICKGFRFTTDLLITKKPIYNPSPLSLRDQLLTKITINPIIDTLEPRVEIQEKPLSSSSFLSIIRDSFQKICVEVNPFSTSRKYAWRILGKSVPRHFTKQIEDMNAVFGQQQIENIHYTISLIDKQTKTEKSDQIMRQNINKCINWCIEHEIPYNNLINTNMFIHSSSLSNNTKSQESLHELSI